ncbi:MAG: hypothetical protein IJP74_07390 [Prevotella sp.]|nr:hypothetical protein [Prevotella sp.]
MKRNYKRPSLHVVAVQHQHPLLQFSGKISGYSKSSSGFSQESPSRAGFSYEDDSQDDD